MGILISILLVTFASCSSEKVKAVIVDATITISPTDPTKVNFMVNEGRYKNLYVQSDKGHFWFKSRNYSFNFMQC